MQAKRKNIAESQKNKHMKSTKYTSHQPDEHGHIPYSAEENLIWHDLIKRQLPQ